MLEYDTRSGTITLSLTGEIDIAVASRIDDQVTAALAAQPLTLAVRLSDIAFIDSTGLGCLVRARNACLRGGTAFVIAEPSTQVARLLALTGLDRVMTITGPDADTPAR